MHPGYGSFYEKELQTELKGKGKSANDVCEKREMGVVGIKREQTMLIA